MDALYKLNLVRGADYVIEVAGVQNGFTEGIGVVRHGATFLSIGMLNLGLTVPYDLGSSIRCGIRI